MATVTSARAPALIDWISVNVTCADATGMADKRRGGGPRLRGDAAVERS